MEDTLQKVPILLDLEHRHLLTGRHAMSENSKRKGPGIERISSEYFHLFTAHETKSPYEVGIFLSVTGGSSEKRTSQV